MARRRMDGSGGMTVREGNFRPDTKNIAAVMENSARCYSEICMLFLQSFIVPMYP